MARTFALLLNLTSTGLEKKKYGLLNHTLVGCNDGCSLYRFVMVAWALELSSLATQAVFKQREAPRIEITIMTERVNFH